MDLTSLATRAYDSASTILEKLFWGWMLGLPHAAELYVAELEITELDGNGDEPDDFPGILTTSERI